MSSTQEQIASFAKHSLRRKILNVALTAPEFRRTLDEAATEIVSFATSDATEATIEGAFERILYAHLRSIGLKFHPDKEFEVNLKRHITRGRIDSRLGALIIEYKRPSLLKSATELKHAIEQLKRYLIALSNTSDSPFVGLLTNGIVVIEVRALHGEIKAQSAVEKLSGATLLRLTQQFISLAFTALTPSNLIRDFCGSDTEGVLFHTARVLNAVLADPKPKTQMLLAEWEAMFRLAHDDQSQQQRIADRRNALGSLFSIDVVDAAIEYRSLFAIHTAYAILLKFMAYRTVSDIYLGMAGQDYRSLATAANTTLRIFCSKLEDGEVFRQLGIVNLLEGDFFSWYCDKNQWTPELADSIRAILETLARYEEAGHIFEANEAPDLFRDLYQAAVPRVVRSSFGEFYTPFWLAEHVLESASPKGEWRAIDPCCGSGTFVIAAIAKLKRECESKKLSKAETLHQILTRVAAIDLNPLGVLTTRINYFIHISNLFNASDKPLVIPVYLGDAANIPDHVSIEGIACLSFKLKTLKTPIQTVLPVSLVSDTAKFMQLMVAYERDIKTKKHKTAKQRLLGGIPKDQRTFSVRRTIAELTNRLIELEENGWNGIWARILSNFLTTACLGRFSVVIGNPPWIDWKNLPEGYRNRIKGMCINSGLFSGAGRTGGINLNICALISYVAMTNWMEHSGRLAFLMPRELATQASYEGWRRLDGKWRFLRFNDWSKAGHPFDPVKEDFMTFVIGRGKSEDCVPVTFFTENNSSRQKAAEWGTWDIADTNLTRSKGVAGRIIPDSTALTFAQDRNQLDEFGLVAGECEYLGREGIEFYPQELQLFRFDAVGPNEGTVWLRNIQVAGSKYRIQQHRVLLETIYLFPVAKGPEIAWYEHNYTGLIVAFPYEESDPMRPVSAAVLRERSPLLLDYYERFKEIIEKQTKFSDRIRGVNPGEFYGVARTGPYSFANGYVGYRDNTKWCATVIDSTRMPWGERKRFVFQNHAVSICERRSDERFINKDEAHFICAIFNTPIVEQFISATSDDRSYKIRPPVFVPLFDPDDERHKKLATLSREAHTYPDRRNDIRKESEQVYLNLCGNEAYDALVASDCIDEIEEGTVTLITGEALEAELDSLSK